MLEPGAQSAAPRAPLLIFMAMNRTVLAQCWACAVSCFAMSAFAGAKDGHGGHLATLTILEGPIQLVRGTTKLSAVEGARLEADDILETQAGTTHARVETVDGLVIDIGPSTRVMLGAAGGSAWRAYMLEGWAKLSAARPSARVAAPLVATPLLDVATADTETVLHVDRQTVELFTPSGPAVVHVKSKDGKAVLTKLDRGKHLVRQADGATQVRGLPPPAFVQAMPLPFRDTLPSRLALFQDRNIKLAPAGTLAYADVAHWLQAEPRVRVLFIPRLRPLLRDEAFRKPLAAQMSRHPEWRPILHPPISSPASKSGKAPMPHEAPASIQP